MMTYKEFKKYVKTTRIPHKPEFLLSVKIPIRDFDPTVWREELIECEVQVYEEVWKEETMRKMYKICCDKIKSLGDNL